MKSICTNPLFFLWGKWIPGMRIAIRKGQQVNIPSPTIKRQITNTQNKQLKNLFILSNSFSQQNKTQ